MVYFSPEVKVCARIQLSIGWGWESKTNVWLSVYNKWHMIGPPTSHLSGDPRAVEFLVYLPWHRERGGYIGLVKFPITMLHWYPSTKFWRRNFWVFFVLVSVRRFTYKGPKSANSCRLSLTVLLRRPYRLYTYPIFCCSWVGKLVRCQMRNNQPAEPWKMRQENVQTRKKLPA